MTQYTDTQLKQVLVKMLPETIDWDNNCLGWIGTRNVRTNVSNTELLYLCWLVESGLNRQDRRMFTNELQTLCQGDAFTSVSATWQQRTIALAKTLYIKII